MKFIMLALIFSPMILGIFIYIINREKFNRTIFLLQFILSTLVGVLCYLNIFKNHNMTWVVGEWSKFIGIELKVTGIGILFLVMTQIAIWYIFLYSWYDKKNNSKFLFFIEFIQSSLCMLFLVNDLFSMFIGFELITIISSILIFFKNDVKSLKAGLYYLLYNSVGMTLYLLGLILLYIKLGSLNIDYLTIQISEMAFDGGLAFCYSLFFVSFSLKSAIFPLNSWLPLVHSSASTVISAFLSGLLVKIGLYGLIKINIMMPLYRLDEFIIIIGIVSSFIGIFGGLIQNDMKRILAFSTISQIGIILVGIMSLKIGNIAVGLHLFNHFVSKSLLFLIIGLLITLTKERDIRKIKSVYKFSPIISLGLIIGILSMTGAPFFAGNLSKNLLKSSKYIMPLKAYFYIINFGTMLLLFRFIKILFGNTIKRAKLEISQNITILFLVLIIIFSYPIELVILKFIGISVDFNLISNIVKEFVVYIGYILLTIISYRRFTNIIRKLSKVFVKKQLSFSVATGILVTYFALIVFYVYIV